MSPFIPAAATAKSAHGSPTRGHGWLVSGHTGSRGRAYDPSSSSVRCRWPADARERTNGKNGVTSNLG